MQLQVVVDTVRYVFDHKMYRSILFNVVTAKVINIMNIKTYSLKTCLFKILKY